jgi:hypothetical protein
MSIADLSREELNELIGAAMQGECSAAAHTLAAAAERATLEARRSTRHVPVHELLDIYVGRRDLALKQGRTPLPGLVEFVRLLERSPRSEWRIIALSRNGAGIGGLFQCSASGDVGAIAFATLPTIS